MAQPTSLVEHADIILPGVIYLLKAIAWIIGSGFSALCIVIGYVGRLWAKKIESHGDELKKHGAQLDEINRKIGIQTDITANCTGCQTAVSAAIKAGQLMDRHQSDKE